MCPVTLVTAELWKLGQLRPDDRVLFKLLTPEEAASLTTAHESLIEELRAPTRVDPAPARVVPLGSPILATLRAQGKRPRVVYRRSGDANLLVEYGELVLDVELRLRVHALRSWLDDRRQHGVLDLTPGIRSLQVHYDSRVLSTDRLMSLLIEGEDCLGRNRRHGDTDSHHPSAFILG